jgi:anti-sigma factor RsiW
MTPDRIDLETLMAYADGALAPEAAARVERHLAHDPAARAQVEQLRTSAALARAALDSDLAQPVPAALQRSVEQAIAAARAQRAAADCATPAAASARADTLSSPSPSAGAAPRPAARAPRRSWLAVLGLDLQPRHAMAASAATLAAGVIGYLMGTGAPDSAPSAPATLLVASADDWAALTRTLNATASGERLALPTGAQVEMVASFTTGSGGLCREFRWARETAYLAVACRDAQAWTIQVATLTAGGDGYAPAASPTAAIDAFITAVGGGAPLSPADEARALAAR